MKANLFLYFSQFKLNLLLYLITDFKTAKILKFYNDIFVCHKKFPSRLSSEYFFLILFIHNILLIFVLFESHVKLRHSNIVYSFPSFVSVEIKNLLLQLQNPPSTKKERRVLGKGKEKGERCTVQGELKRVKGCKK